VNVAEYVGNAIATVIGTYIIHILIGTFRKSDSGFCEYGWLLMGAHIAGIIVYLKYGLSRKD